jgi:IclR family pca regulon transcriptional regulator
VNAINDSCVLAIRHGDHAITIASANSTSFGAVNALQGQKISLYVSTPGRLLLAHLPPAELAEYLSSTTLRRFTRHTVTSKSAVRDQVNRIREQGYAVGRGEFELGVYAIAVPVRTRPQNTVAAIGCIGNVARLETQKAVDQRVALLNRAAERLRGILPERPDFSEDLRLATSA